MMPIAETERLYFRHITIDNAQDLIDLNSNPNVIRYTGDGPLESLQKAQHIIQNIILPQYANKIGRWAVHLKSNNAFIGWCGLKHIHELNEIDLGYRFFEEHWGKGYATESACAVLNYGFNLLGLKEVVARVAINNLNSIKVLKKVGMQFEKEELEDGEKIYKYRLTSAQYPSQF